MLTSFYASLFRATEVQKALPKWVDLNRQFHNHELLPTIDGSLLKHINLFANNKSCASDQIIAEMLGVLDEDVRRRLRRGSSTRSLSSYGGSRGNRCSS